MPNLSARDVELLEFSRLWWRHGGLREVAVRERFGCSMTRFWQELIRVIDLPEALAYDPLEVRRLRAIRDGRQLSRSVRRSA